MGPINALRIGMSKYLMGTVGVCANRGGQGWLRVQPVPVAPGAGIIENSIVEGGHTGLPYEVSAREEGGHTGFPYEGSSREEGCHDGVPYGDQLPGRMEATRACCTASALRHELLIGGHPRGPHLENRARIVCVSRRGRPTPRASTPASAARQIPD